MKTEREALKPGEYIIHCSPGDLWYIAFIDPNGVERFFPTRKKWFGKWTPFNCPKSNPPGAPPDVYAVMDPATFEDESSDVSPELVLDGFKRIYPTPEDYLMELNSK